VPTVAVVDGAKIQLYANEHPPPHFHVVFAEYRVQIDIATLTVLRGSLPRAKLATVLAWAEPRKPELLKAWETVVANELPGKIR